MREKKRIGVKDIIQEFLFEGTAGVENLLATHGPVSRTTMKESLRELRRRGTDIEGLNAWCKQEFGYSLSGERGRKAPTAGDTRRVKIQQDKNTLFVKTPIIFSGAEKGGYVRLDFSDKRVIVEPE